MYVQLKNSFYHFLLSKRFIVIHLLKKFFIFLAEQVMNDKLNFYVFLDTNIFESENFDFFRYKLKNLLDHCINGNVILLTSPIVINEVKGHIKEEIQKSLTYQKKFIKNSRILKSFEDKDIVKITNAFDIKKITELKISDFEKYLKETSAISLQLETINLNEIIQNYFAGSAPFSGKKKYEFPDAFIANSLKNYEDFVTDKIYLVSNDKDFNEICKGNAKLCKIDKLTDILSLINEKMENYQLLKDLIDEYLNENKVELIQKINNILLELEFSSDMDNGCEDEIEYIDIIENEIDSEDIISIGEEYIECEYGFQATLKAYHRRTDYIITPATN